MRSTAVYNYIRVYLAPKDQKQYQAMTTQAGKDYYLCPVALPSNRQISIDTHSYQVVDQHVSFYADPSVGAYHLTTRVAQDGHEFIIHCYFDSKGNPDPHNTITMKADTIPVATHVQLTTDAQKMLRNYSVQHAELIQTVNRDLVNKQDQLEAAINNKQQRVDELSEIKKTSQLKPYIDELCKLIKLIQEFNFITNYSMKGDLNLLRKRLAVCEDMLASTPTPELKKTADKKLKKSAPKQTEPVETFQKEKSRTEEESGTEEKSEIPTVTLESIKEKLAELKAINLTTLQEQQKLLKIKLKLIHKKNHALIIETYNKLDKVAAQIRKTLFDQATKGDIEAANTIIKNKYFISRRIYFLLVYHGQEQVFDMFMERCSQANAFINAVSNIADPPLCLLEVAHLQKHESLFRKLLFVYHCNPNQVTFSGKRLLHIVAENGSVAYAKILLEAGANVNEESVAGEITTYSINDQPFKTIPKSTSAKDFHEIKNILAKLKEMQVPICTPLLNAIINSKKEMVELLVAHNADVMNLRSELGADAITIHAANKFAPLDAMILLTLVKAGGSIDSRWNYELGQFTPLYFKCHHLEEQDIRLLINQFAADPNILLTKINKETNEKSFSSCLLTLLDGFLDTETLAKATNIILFLLDQDIRPLIAHTLEQCLTHARKILPIITTFSTDDLDNHKKIAQDALKNHEYDVFLHHSEVVRSAHFAPIYTAILKNKMKLDLVKAAEENLGNRDYQHCVAACETALSAKFNIQQYNERLWAAYSKAQMHLGNNEQACKALEHYLKILTQKESQTLSPKYKAELHRKMADASTQLAEVHEKLLIQTASQVHVMHPARLFKPSPSQKMSVQVQFAKKQIVLKQLKELHDDKERETPPTMRKASKSSLG